MKIGIRLRLGRIARGQGIEVRKSCYRSCSCWLNTIYRRLSTSRLAHGVLNRSGGTSTCALSGNRLPEWPNWEWKDSESRECSPRSPTFADYHACPPFVYLWGNSCVFHWKAARRRCEAGPVVSAITLLRRRLPGFRGAKVVFRPLSRLAGGVLRHSPRCAPRRALKCSAVLRRAPRCSGVLRRA